MLRLRINSISIISNEKCETQFVPLTYNHFTKGFEKMFDDIKREMAYKTKQPFIGNRKNKNIRIFEINFISCNDWQSRRARANTTLILNASL